MSEPSASFLISSATTANPLPASPALAASIDALSASRFVWLAIDVMVSRIALMEVALLSKSTIAFSTLSLDSRLTLLACFSSSKVLIPSSLTSKVL